MTPIPILSNQLCSTASSLVICRPCNVKECICRENSDGAALLLLEVMTPAYNPGHATPDVQSVSRPINRVTLGPSRQRLDPIIHANEVREVGDFKQIHHISHCISTRLGFE